MKDNLSEKNVLLVLQHICLYCSSATSRSSNEFLLDEAQPPITVVPKRGRSISACLYDDEPNLSAPSAPPLPTISENEEEDHPLLYQDEIMLLEDADEREFEAGMAVSSSKGRKVMRIHYFKISWGLGLCEFAVHNKGSQQYFGFWHLSKACSTLFCGVLLTQAR